MSAPAAGKQRVALVKMSPGGRVPIGTTYAVHLPAELGVESALVRALRMLRRDLPHENPECWRPAGDHAPGDQG